MAGLRAWLPAPGKKSPSGIPGTTWHAEVVETKGITKLMMKRRKCGETGLDMPILGVGTWAFGGGEYWGWQDQKDVDSVVHRALDVGCNYFDSAEMYNKGASESSLGAALKGRRGEAIIGTKINPSNAYARTLVEHCEASLKRLSTDYIDVYMIHWPIHPHSIRHFTEDAAVINNPPTVQEALATMGRLKEQGKIRHIGVSNFGVKRFEEALKLCPQIVVNELPYSLLTRAVEMHILPCCRRRKVGVIGYMTLLQGLLADIYPSLKEVPPWQRRTRHFSCKSGELTRHGEEGAEDQTNQALTAIRAVCKKYGMTMPEIAVKWAVANEAITCALVGARNVAEFDANVKAVSEPLPAEIVAELDAATKPLMDKMGPGFDYYENTKDDRT